jgi:PAS domain S-box-containing protein
MTQKPTYEELEQKVKELEKTDSKRKQAEEALRESEIKYRALIEYSNDVIICADKDGDYKFVNNVFASMFGKTPEYFVGKSFWDVYPKEDADQRYEANKKVYQTGEGVTIEFVVPLPGKTLYYIATINPVKDPQGGVIFVLTHGTDITERKQAEEMLQKAHDELEKRVEERTAELSKANERLKHEIEERDRVDKILRESEVFLKEAQRVGHLGSWSLNVVTGVLQWSDECYRIYGFRPQEFVATYEKFRSIIHPEDFGFVQEQVDAALNNDKHYDLDFRFVRPNGEIGWIHCVGKVIRDAEGKPLNFLGTQIDITDRKRAEEALKESEERFRHLSEATFEAIVFHDEGEILHANEQYYEMFEYDPDEVIGKDAISLTTTPDSLKLIREQVSLGNLGPYEVIGLKKGGIEFPMEIRAKVTEYHGRKIRMAAIRDLTKRKWAEEALLESEARLQQSQKMEAIGTLAGGIAHDFNNVLYSIIGYTELTMDDVPEGSVAQSNLKEVFKGAMRAKDMVQQILAFSRKADTEKKPIKVQSAVTEALKLLRTSIPATIEIRQNIDADCSPVLADSTQIHQVIMNLATNAYQAMREKGGVLELNLMEEEIRSDDSDLDLHPGKYLKLTVSDTGHGMDNVVVEKIFDPYFSTKGPGEGTGMGLAVVHGIVKDHGGDIEVYSKLGEGTTFSVYLPLVETRSVEPKAIYVEPVPMGTERILFVDDEETIVLMTQQTLERLGYQVTPRTSSVEALEAFRAQPDNFDLVITDFTMPNMTGIELASKLLEIRPDIPIIICTGFSEVIDKNRAKAAGIREYVMKPIVKDQIARIIRKVLDERLEK